MSSDSSVAVIVVSGQRVEWGCTSLGLISCESNRGVLLVQAGGIGFLAKGGLLLATSW